MTHTQSAPPIAVRIKDIWNKRMRQTRFPQARQVSRWVILHAVLLAVMGLGYALIVMGLTLLFGKDLPPVVVGALIFCLALIFMPVRQFLSKKIDSVFFQGEQVFQERIQNFSGELTGTVDTGEVVRILRAYIRGAILPSRLHIFIYDPLIEQYVSTPDDDGQRTSDLRFQANSPLVQILSSRRSTFQFLTETTIPAAMQPELARIALLGARLFVPLPGRQRLAGWVALGSRQTGENYTSRDIHFVETLGDQAAVAIERAQVVQNMENRVREMNVLTRVAQGINVTIQLDDILELIYAQTTQIIPADNFHILLKDESSGELEEIFYVEGNERFAKYENIPLSGDPVLEQEVIKQRRPILTDDYGLECQRYGILSDRIRAFAWMGVPLNAGADTIGAISLAKREQETTYTREQMNLLQAIADQVAGAIVKARLLQETERKARQMASLNEITHQLTSTLELSPLLQSILFNAVEILGTEAGSLLLVDSATEELVFEVAAGPVAESLIGQRLPPGKGVVGRAVEIRQPIIVNDIQSSPDWFSKNDEETGFSTQSLLVVPLEVQDEVIGVIEVLNKRDGSIFTLADQELLSAFAAQAAMAIHNARLYTTTDQALSARVEELSVLQRVDRELNAGLDTSRAMRVTLEWAMRQSQADAGLIGNVIEGGMNVIAAEGFEKLVAGDGEITLTNAQFHPLEAAETGGPVQWKPDENHPALLEGACTRLIIPIRREADTMGYLLLESSREQFEEEAITFLTRLSDHAAIAISNAQLYSAVQSANIAKSEFVSFVSHELKNPMTSIKGYTELLAAGAVGPVNEAQANFLATIKSNVDRMSTLVSDLNDVSRIEAGRLKLDFKAFKLREVIDEVVRSLRKQVDEKRQKLIFNLPDDLPQLWADRSRVVQVVTNLVSNAYKYTPLDGEITVGAEESDNQWDPNGAARVIHFWVQDTGIGISQEDQAKIFQKFFRSEDPKTREAPGTGLGLNITRSLVELQGGKIWFESEFRKGTTFHFTLPVAD